MSAKRTGKSVSQRAIAFLLILQTTLICIQAGNRIQHGDSSIDVLMWMINQCIPVLKQVSSLQDKHKGREQGRHEEMLSGIELALELKFGSEGLQLMPEISQISDLERLKAIREGIKTMNTLEELQQLIF